MTLTTEVPQTVAGTVESFFDAYRRQDVFAMADLCSPNADFHYDPFEMWGKQRVVRGDGKVHGIGRVIWTGLIQSFPDLTNEITSLSTNESSGEAIAEVTLSGTQAAAWGSFSNRGLRFSVPHLFCIHLNSAGLIDSVTAYWDNASVSRQLGHLEVD